MRNRRWRTRQIPRNPFRPAWRGAYPRSRSLPSSAPAIAVAEGRSARPRAADAKEGGIKAGDVAHGTRGKRVGFAGVLAVRMQKCFVRPAFGVNCGDQVSAVQQVVPESTCGGSWEAKCAADNSYFLH